MVIFRVFITSVSKAIQLSPDFIVVLSPLRINVNRTHLNICEEQRLQSITFHMITSSHHHHHSHYVHIIIYHLLLNIFKGVEINETLLSTVKITQKYLNSPPPAMAMVVKETC